MRGATRAWLIGSYLQEVSMSDTTNLNLDSTKSAARPSHEAIESHTGEIPNTEQEKVDQVAMDGAKRAQNRIHSEEQKNPEDTIFSNI